MANELVQYGALPWRRREGGVEIMLITTRTTGRWMAPKGSQMADRTAWEAAAQEAYEEAGIRGQITKTPIGHFHYDKKRKSGEIVRLRVDVFGLEVLVELESWPEVHERQRRWFPQAEAALAVVEPELAALISAFAP